MVLKKKKNEIEEEKIDTMNGCQYATTFFHESTRESIISFIEVEDGHRHNAAFCINVDNE